MLIPAHSDDFWQSGADYSLNKETLREYITEQTLVGLGLYVDSCVAWTNGDSFLTDQNPNDKKEDTLKNHEMIHI